MKKALVFGTFDILHPGHVDFLKQAKKHGDSLIVVVARDSTVKKVKGKKPKYSEKKRLAKIKKLKIVDDAFLGNKKGKYSIIEKIMPDVVCLGYDQNSFTKNLRQELKKRKIKAKIVRLKPYKAHKYKSSKLRKG